MSDLIDAANIREQFVLDASIKSARDKAAAMGGKHFEFCQLCGDPTVDGAAYCGEDCLVEARRVERIRAKQFAGS